MTNNVEQMNNLLGVVLGRARHVIEDERLAEDAAVEVVRRFVTGSVPGWLQAADEQTRLDALTVIHVLKINRTRPQLA